MRIAITGAAGRMGRELIKVALSEERQSRCRLVGASVRDDSALFDKDIGQSINNKAINLNYSSDFQDMIRQAEAVIDFSAPEHSLEVARIAAQNDVIHICGTTGFTNSQLAEMEELAKNILIFWSPNMSIAVNVVSSLVRQAAALLDESFDIEILEMHHKHKIDVPSGTALMMGKAAAQGRGLNFDQAKILDRMNNRGPRKEGGIGFASLRGGGVIGEHFAIFASPSEKVELSHTMYDRSIYAKNAFKIAYWAKSQVPGKLYSMQDFIDALHIV